MEFNYVIILDFFSGSLSIIKLTKEELKESEEYDDFSDFLETLEEKYEFSLKDCQWMVTENLNAYIFEGGVEKNRLSFSDLTKNLHLRRP